MPTNPYQPPGTEKSRMTRRGMWIFFPVFFLAFVNFAVFVAVAVNIGGDAINGEIRDGRYYLMTGGEYTEVSRAVYAYSYIHAMSVWVSVAAVFIVAGCLLWSGDWIRDPRRAGR